MLLTSTTMSECTLFCVLFFASISFVFSNSIDFEECGGDPVNSVVIDGCFESPCVFRRGATHHFFITMEYINPIVDSMTVNADIMQYGAIFKQHTMINNPCIYSCPVTQELLQPQFDLNIMIDPKLVSMPGLLEINGTYYKGNSQTGGFCILTFVDII